MMFSTMVQVCSLSCRWKQHKSIHLLKKQQLARLTQIVVYTSCFILNVKWSVLIRTSQSAVHFVMNRLHFSLQKCIDMKFLLFP